MYTTDFFISRPVILYSLSTLTVFVLTVMEVNGKVSIITGSAQGLGKAFAARLLEAGGKVCISDVNEDKGEATLAELRERFGKDR